jgi:hypothetical protein
MFGQEKGHHASSFLPNKFSLADDRQIITSNVHQWAAADRPVAPISVMQKS